MRRDSWSGDLTLGSSRPGAVVRCVQAPGPKFLSFWKRFMGKQAFLFFPQHKEFYIIRANIRVIDELKFEQYFKCGVQLTHQQSRQPLRNAIISLNGGMHFEPFFPFDCFDSVRGNP